MARDDIENRGFKPTIPTDLNDRPRFSQTTETAKDAFVLELRKFFDAAQTAGRIAELPTVEKYAVGFGTGLDPYETTIQILQEFTDVGEGLPHVAVLAAGGQSRRLTIGPPFIAHVQLPPRVTTANPEPYALTDGDSFVFRTTPYTGHHGDTNQFSAVTSTIVFPADRFPSANPITSATAADVARIFNARALYATARVVDLPGGVGQGVQFEAGGKLSAGQPKNEIEVLAASSPGLVSALGLGDFGTAAIGDSIAPAPASPSFAFALAAAPFSPAMASDGRYLTLAGTPTADNSGRFPITSAVPGTLTYTNAEGAAEVFAPGDPTVTWFVGYRDTTENPLRPPMNRYHIATDLTLGVQVLAESPNTRRELLDLVWSFFDFWLEERHFTLYGRNVFAETVYDGDGNPVTDEHYQLSLHSDVRASGDNDIPRPDDNKNLVHTSRLDVPVTLLQFIDRPTTVLSGPSQGSSWTLNAANVVADDTTPLPS